MNIIEIYNTTIMVNDYVIVMGHKKLYSFPAKPKHDVYDVLVVKRKCNTKLCMHYNDKTSYYLSNPRSIVEGCSCNYEIKKVVDRYTVEELIKKNTPIYKIHSTYRPSIFD